MFSRKLPWYWPAAAIELAWWKHTRLHRVRELQRVVRAHDVREVLLLAVAFRS